MRAGLMLTDMEPPTPEALKAMVANLSIQRVSDPAEIAAAITFLASPAASYITGAVLDANGGLNCLTARFQQHFGQVA